jgi:hypothetical protein
MGVVKPVITIHYEDGPDILLPADEHETIESVRLSVARKLNKPAANIGIFGEDGLEDDEFEVRAGQELQAASVATLKIHVIVPEGGASADGEDDPTPGLEGVTVELDGETQGVTDEFGEWSLTTRLGTRRIHLWHPCYGPKGREVKDVCVELGQPNLWAVLADIRVYIFASKADADAEQDLLASTHSSSCDAGSDVEKSSFGTVLVWICSSTDQIQGDMLSIEGCVSGEGLGGEQISVNLGTGATEVNLVAGAELGDAPLQRCSLASLRCEVSKLGYVWRPRDPSPLKDRAEEIGGCEYLRLLACPTVMGYLDPAVLVKTPNEDDLWLPVIEYGTVGRVKERLEKEFSVPAKEMALFRAGVELEDSVVVTAGMVLTMKNVAPIELKVVTGCCCEPFDGVSVSVDGQDRGVTNKFGKVTDFSLTEGEHSLKLEHMV